MGETKTYKVGDKFVDIPSQNSEAFLKKVPDAIEYKSFIVDNDTVDIPLKNVDAFLAKVPHAKPTFETEQPKATPTVSAPKENTNGMALDMQAAVTTKKKPQLADPENTIDVTVYKDVNGKPIQTQDPVNQNFEWSKGVSTQTPRTEAERISATADAKEAKEQKLGEVVKEFQKGGGSTTESKLLTYNNYAAAKKETADRISNEIATGKEAKLNELQQAAQERIAQNPKYQEVIQAEQEKAKQYYAKLINEGYHPDQAKGEVESVFAKSLENNPDIKALQQKEGENVQAGYDNWVKEKVRGEVKYFKDGLPQLYNEVLQSKAFLESTNDDKRQLITQMWGTIEKRMLNSKKDPKVIAEAKKDFYYKAMEQASFNQDGQLTPLALKDYAEATLPQVQKAEKELTDKFDKTGDFDAQQVIQKELNNVVAARKNLESIISMPDAAHGSFVKGFKDGTSIPFVTSVMDAVDNVSLYKIAKKAQAGEELTESEKQRLMTEGMSSQYQQQAEPSSAYNIGQSTAASLIFMGELAATGGVNKAATKGIEKIVMGKLAKTAGEAAVNTARYQLVAKPLMGLIGAGAQTLANPQMYIKNTTERILPSFQVALSPEGDKLTGVLDWATQNQKGYNTGKGEDIPTALARGLGTTFSDIFSESVFRALPSVTDPMKKAMLHKLVENSELSKRLFIGYYMAKEGLDASGVYKRLRAGGVPIDGLVDEVLENIVNEGMTNFITGDNRVSNAILKDDDSIDWKKLKENVIATGGMVGILGVGGKVLHGKDKKMVVNVQDVNGNASNLDVGEKTVSFIANNLKDKSFAEIKSWAKQNIGRIKPKEREAAMAIINGYAGKNVFEGSIADQQWVKDINKQVAENVVGGVNTEIADFANERKRIDEIYSQDWDNLSEEEIKKHQDDRDLNDEKAAKIFDKYATKEEKDKYEKMQMYSRMDEFRGKVGEIYRNAHNYREDVLDRITSGITEFDTNEGVVDFTHTVNQTGNEPVVTVEMPDGNIQVVENLGAFVVENKDDLANGNIDITIDNATPEQKMVVNAAINGTEEERDAAMKQYGIEAPKIKTEPIAPATVVEQSTTTPSEQMRTVEDIEADRKEELKRMNYDELTAEFKGNTLGLIQNEEKLRDAAFRVIDVDAEGVTISYIKPNGDNSNFSIPITNEKTLAKYKEKYKNVEWNDNDINAKYDAELAALKVNPAEAITTKAAVSGDAAATAGGKTETNGTKESTSTDVKPNVESGTGDIQGSDVGTEKGQPATETKEVETVAEKADEAKQKGEVEDNSIGEDFKKRLSAVNRTPIKDHSKIKVGDFVKVKDADDKGVPNKSGSLSEGFVTKITPKKITIESVNYSNAPEIKLDESVHYRENIHQLYETSDLPKDVSGETEKKSSAEPTAPISATYVDVTTLKKNDEFYSGGEKFKFISNEPDGRVTVRTQSGSTYTTEVAKFKDATIQQPNAPTTRSTENKGAETNQTAPPKIEGSAVETVRETKTKPEQPEIETNDGGGKEVKTKLQQLEDALKAAEQELSAALRKGRSNAGMFKGVFAGFPQAITVAKLHIQILAEKGMLTFQNFLASMKKSFPDATDEDVTELWNEVVNAKTTEEEKAKSFETRFYDSKAVMNDADLRDAVAKQGLNYKVEAWQDAEQAAKNLITEIGIDNALHAARTGIFPTDSAAKAYVYAAALQDLQTKGRMEQDPELKNEFIKREIALVAEMGEISRGGGRWNSALFDIYQNSDIGFSLASLREKATSANKGKPLTKEQEKMLDGFAETINKLNEQLKELKEKIEKADAEDTLRRLKEGIENETKEAAKEPKEKKIKEAAKKLADKFRQGKLHRPGMFSQATPLSVVWDGAIETIAKTIEAGGTVAEAIAKGLKFITDSKAYKDLSNDDKLKAEKEFNDFTSEQRKEETKEVKQPYVEKGELKLPDGFVNAIIAEGLASGDIKPRDEKGSDPNGVQYLVDKVYEALTPELQQQFSKRQVQDAISKYGKTKYPNQEEIAKTRREFNRDLQLASAFEDALNNKRPSKSGAQRDNPLDRHKDLMKRIQDLLRDFPEDAADVEKKFKTAQDKIAERLREKIRLLNEQIYNNERIVRPVNSIEYIESNKVLQEQVRELEKVLDDLVGKKQLTHEQKVVNALAAIERQRIEYERRIKAKDFDKSEKEELSDPRLDAAKATLKQAKKNYDDAKLVDNPNHKKEALYAQRLKAAEKAFNKLYEDVSKKNLAYKQKKDKEIVTGALKATREATKGLNEILNAMREDAGLAEKRRLELWKERAKKSIAKTNEQLRTGRFTSNVKKNIELDAEGLKLEHEKQRVKDQAITEIEKIRLENRGIWEKFTDGAGNVLSMPISLVATGDFSGILRQGKILTTMHPVIAVQALDEMRKMTLSQEYTDKWFRALHASDQYQIMKRAGLFLGEPNAKLTAREELKASNLPEKIPGYGEYWVKPTNRAYHGYLNVLRASTFMQFMDGLDAAGITGKQRDMELKEMATFINEATGRGHLGIANRLAPLLNMLYFSPRFVASRVKLMARALAIPLDMTIGKAMNKAGLDLKISENAEENWLAGAIQDLTMHDTPMARKEAMKGGLLYLANVLSVIALVSAMNKDDEDDDFYVDLNPTSSDFLKMRFGDTRIDLLSGFQQVFVLLARLATQTYTTQKQFVGGEFIGGESSSIYGEGSTKSVMDVLGDFSKNKLSPTSQMLYDGLMTGKNSYDNEIFGMGEIMGYDLGKRNEDFNLAGSMLAKVPPMWQNDIWDIGRENGAMLGSVAGTLSFLGEGVSNYESSYNEDNYVMPDNKTQQFLNKNDVAITRFKPSKDADGISGTSIQGVHIPLTEEQAKAVDMEMEKIMVKEIEQRMDSNKKIKVEALTTIGKKLATKTVTADLPKLSTLDKDNLSKQIGLIKERAKEVALVKLGYATMDELIKLSSEKQVKDALKGQNLINSMK